MSFTHCVNNKGKMNRIPNHMQLPQCTMQVFIRRENFSLSGSNFWKPYMTFAILYQLIIYFYFEKERSILQKVLAVRTILVVMGGIALLPHRSRFFCGQLWLVFAFTARTLLDCFASNFYLGKFEKLDSNSSDEY